MQRLRHSSFGFTLIELVIVMSLLGIISVISFDVISSSTRSALTASQRQEVSSQASVLAAHMSRALQNALPNSIRVTPDGRCLEYIPIKKSTVYTALNVGQLATQMTVIGDGRAVSGRLVVYPLSSTNLYADWLSATHAGSITRVNVNLPAQRGEVTLSLSPAHRFNTAPPVPRVYWLGTPITWCQKGTFLYEYQNYTTTVDVSDLTAQLPNTQGAGRNVLAYPMDADAPMRFTYFPATLLRNGLVRIEYSLSLNLDDVSQTFGQEVHIRNVP